MKSVFRDCQQDRLWKFGCGFNEASKEFCHWNHGYANDAEDGIFFYCPNNGFISGKAFNHEGSQLRRKMWGPLKNLGKGGGHPETSTLYLCLGMLILSTKYCSSSLGFDVKAVP